MPQTQTGGGGGRKPPTSSTVTADNPDPYRSRGEEFYGQVDNLQYRTLGGEPTMYRNAATSPQERPGFERKRGPNLQRPQFPRLWD